MSAEITRGLVILWAEANGHTNLAQPWVDHKTGKIGAWKDSQINQPTDSTLRAAGTDEEALAAIESFREKKTIDRELGTMTVYRVVEQVYKKLSPLTPDGTIRANMKKWIKQSR